MASDALTRLERVRDRFGGEASRRKLELLRELGGSSLSGARRVTRLHETLCFMRAYPDDAKVLRRVEAMLRGFGRRADLRRHAEALADSGISGTTIDYAFYWPTTQWLVSNWPRNVEIRWEDLEQRDPLDRLLTLLMPYSETLALEEAGLDVDEWVRLLKGSRESEAEFLVRRVERLDVDARVRESLFDELTLPLRITPGRGTPTRTLARYGRSPVVWREGALDRSRPDLREACDRAPEAVREVPLRQGRVLIDLAREAMVTRSRDLYAFKYADPHDVRLVDCGEGLQFACIGILPDYRLMLDAVYGFLTLLNGVPIGYVLSSAYFGSVEVAYNVFDTFRGAEAGRVYGRVLGMVRHLFDADVFTVDPYQLGHDNEEGLASGAWWFYYKLGFRPRDASVKRLVRRELGRIGRDPRYRSSPETLQELSSVNMFYYIGRRRDDVRGVLPLETIGLAVSRYLARRFGADRERGIEVCTAEVTRLLGTRALARWTRPERQALKRWSPLVLTLPGVKRWGRADLRSLARVIRAKGGRRESDYVRLLDRHTRLRRALVALAAG